MASNKKILLLGKIDHAHSQWSSLDDIAETIVPKARDRAEFIEECKSGAFDDVFCAYRTLASEAITGRIDEELVSVLPKSLKFLCHNGSGYDQIDPEACTRHDIRVSNVPTAVDDATADVNLFLIIGALRNFNQGMVQLREGNWLNGVPLGHDPEGKTLGVLGLGGIGRALKKRTDAFDMKVIYHNRKRLSPDLENGAEYVSFGDLLSKSDVISLNLPLNSATRHIISTQEFAKMKDGVVIVNTARGAVMDEDALVQALASGKVRSCGLDVFEEEPKVHPGLLSNPSVMLIPHMGTHTYETRTAMECWVIDNLRSAISMGKLKSPIPEQTGM
ncbi:hypothetical protein L873DRAFT_1684120 [Choiromyces venosus 120613-1]|uniref:Glyoxylate reductase n=1 Tax=Choiromyces venosus 120613-1 TaxID=1336337 RepID=A0A3N4JQ39_9PEZI|nr:hypothetical protein L873DRAFT_1684120 [Choiromyces venosus 120613-1]